MLVWAKDSSKIGTELKAIMIQIKVQKNSQENVKNRLFEFLEEFYQYYGYHHKPQVFQNTDDGFEKLRVKINGFKKEQEYLKECIDRLTEMFPKYNVTIGEQEGIKEKLYKFMNSGLQGVKIRDNEADNGEFEESESMLAIEDNVMKKKLCEMEQQVFHEKEADKVMVGEQDGIREKVYKFMYRYFER